MSRDPLEGVRPHDPSGQPDHPSVFVQPAGPIGVGQPDRSSGTNSTKVKLLVLFAVCAVLFGAGVALYLTPRAQPQALRPKVPQVPPTPAPTAKSSDNVVVTQGPSSPIEPPPPPTPKK